MLFRDLTVRLFLASVLLVGVGCASTAPEAESMPEAVAAQAPEEAPAAAPEPAEAEEPSAPPAVESPVADAETPTETSKALRVKAAAETKTASDDAAGPWLPVEGDPKAFYRIVKMPKIESGRYSRFGEDKLRMQWGVTLEIVREDDTAFWVKQYRREREEKPSEPAVEEPVEIALPMEGMAKLDDLLVYEKLTTGLPSVGQWRNGFALADMNGDEHLDVVLSPSRKGFGPPRIYLGDGAGDWKRWQDVTFPELAYDYGDVAVGDLDGDGLLDMVLGVHLRGILVLRATEIGAFEEWGQGVEFDVPGQGGDASSFSSREVELADWNGDGRLDIVALGEGPKGTTLKNAAKSRAMIGTSRGVGVYENQGDGTWVGQRVAPADAQRMAFGDDLDIQDIDGDGDLDLAVASRRVGDQSLLWPNEGDGTVTGRFLSTLPASILPESVAFLSPSQLAIAGSVADHGAGTWKAAILLLDLEEASQDLLWAEPTNLGVSALQVGDLDGDGAADLVAGTGDGRILAFRATPSGEYVLENVEGQAAPATGCRIHDIQLGDIDGDGRDEILAVAAGERTGQASLGLPGTDGCPGEGWVGAWRVAGD